MPDETKSLFEKGFNTVVSVLVTISLGLGSYGLTQVITLKNETSVLTNQVHEVQQDISEINKNVTSLSTDKVIDKIKLDVLGEKISNIDSSLKEMKADLKEALKK
jgi:chaperonin cofactor prefoldin